MTHHSSSGSISVLTHQAPPRNAVMGNMQGYRSGVALARTMADGLMPRRERTVIHDLLDKLEDTYGLFRHHIIVTCVDACSKGLNPTKAIGKIKEIMSKRAV